MTNDTNTFHQNTFRSNVHKRTGALKRKTSTLKWVHWIGVIGSYSQDVKQKKCDEV